MPRKLESFAAWLACLAVLAQSTGAADAPLLVFPAPRPEVFPPALRFGPPRPAAPAASVVQTRPEGAPRALEPSEDPRPAPVWPPERVGPARGQPFAAPPEEPAPPDRILLVAERDFVGVEQLSRALDGTVVGPGGRRAVYARRWPGRWRHGQGIRVRVNYLRPLGVTWGDPRGFHVFLPRVGVLDVPGRVGKVYHERFPLYFAGDRVEYEIELEGAGAEGLTGVTVYVLQESFNESGGYGMPLVDEPGAGPERIGPLAPGQRRVLTGTFLLSRRGMATINFEQTHVLVTSIGARGEKVLLDAPQAGVVDPPNL